MDFPLGSPGARTLAQDGADGLSFAHARNKEDLPLWHPSKFRKTHFGTQRQDEDEAMKGDDAGDGNGEPGRLPPSILLRATRATMRVQPRA